jgi:hypothetical protein
MSLVRRRLLRRLRPGSRPRPPEWLRDRLEEEIPADLFPGPRTPREKGESPSRVLPLSIAASVVLVLLAGLVGIRLREQPDAAPPSSPAKPGQIVGESEDVAGDLRRANEEAGAARDDRHLAPEPLEEEQPPEPEERAAPARAEDSTKDPASRERPRRVLTGREAAAAPTPLRRRTAAPEPAPREQDRLTASRGAPSPAAAEREAAVQPEALVDATEQPLLTLDVVRWHDGELEVGGTAVVRGVVEVRLLGGEQLQRVPVEAGRPFRVSFPDPAGARRVEVRIEGYEERWLQEIPEG